MDHNNVAYCGSKGVERRVPTSSECWGHPPPFQSRVRPSKAGTTNRSARRPVPLRASTMFHHDGNLLHVMSRPQHEVFQHHPDNQAECHHIPGVPCRQENSDGRMTYPPAMLLVQWEGFFFNRFSGIQQVRRGAGVRNPDGLSSCYAEERASPSNPTACARWWCIAEGIEPAIGSAIF